MRILRFYSRYCTLCLLIRTCLFSVMIDARIIEMKNSFSCLKIECSLPTLHGRLFIPTSYCSHSRCSLCTYDPLLLYLNNSWYLFSYPHVLKLVYLRAHFCFDSFYRVPAHSTTKIQSSDRQTCTFCHLALYSNVPASIFSLSPSSAPIVSSLYTPPPRRLSLNLSQEHPKITDFRNDVFLMPYSQMQYINECL